jgi:hypothetical protein
VKPAEKHGAAVANLVIALFWLLIGLALVFVPEFAAWRIRGTDLSVGWVAIALAAYNLLRWFLIRRGQRRTVPPSDLPPQQSREYHSEFDFTKDKSEPGDQRFKSS